MIKDVVDIELPVSEHLRIQKNEIRNGESGKKLSIVTGTHGDELEGQLLVYKLASYFSENINLLDGTLSLYPALNPLGIESLTRGLPGFDFDMNRVFPGNEDGSMVEHMAHVIIEDLSDSDIVIDVHASNIFLTEVPQVRVNEVSKDKLLPLALMLNTDFVWIHSASTVLESTLAYSLHARGIDTLVVEMGVGMRLTERLSDNLFIGVLNLMKSLGMYKGEIEEEIRKPIVSSDPEDVIYLNAPEAGIFLKKKEAGSNVREGETIGLLLDPLRGRIISEIKAQCDGLLFTVREYPVVDQGSLMGRILRR